MSLELNEPNYLKSARFVVKYKDLYPTKIVIDAIQTIKNNKQDEGK
jgi:hypothetical protein